MRSPNHSRRRCEILLAILAASLLAAGCRHGAPSKPIPHPHASEAEIRAKIVGTWRLVQPSSASPPVTVRFSSDGSYECSVTRAGFPRPRARWVASEGFVRLFDTTDTNSALGIQGWLWHVWRVGDQELEVLIGDISAAGPSSTFKRCED